MFSPKVLDRANVIEFNEVSTFEAPSEETKSEFRLKNSDVRGGLDDLGAFCSLDDYYETLKEPSGHHVVDVLNELYRKLKPHHMHFGYRVIFFILVQSRNSSGNLTPKPNMKV